MGPAFNANRNHVSFIYHCDETAALIVGYLHHIYFGLYRMRHLIFISYCLIYYGRREALQLFLIFYFVKVYLLLTDAVRL